MSIIDELKASTYPCPPKDSATRVREITAAYFSRVASKEDASAGQAVEASGDAGDSPATVKDKAVWLSLGNTATDPSVARGPSAPQTGTNFNRVVL
jgi:hypothetical protein